MCMSVIELSSVTYTINYTAKMLMHERSCMIIYQHNYCYWCLLHVYSRKHKVLGQTEIQKNQLFPYLNAYKNKNVTSDSSTIMFMYN